GRSCYELARFGIEVLGVDQSAKFIQAAEEIRTAGSKPYLQPVEGRDETLLAAARPASADPGRIRFEQGDAMNLRADLGEFDIVHAANLLCRLSDPLNRLV